MSLFTYLLLTTGEKKVNLKLRMIINMMENEHNRQKIKTPIYKKSRQRNALLALLRSTTSHPTAAWLYDKLKGDFPILSQGTVYRNLSILSEQGQIKILRSGSAFDRFDANTNVHYHVICEACGKVEDLDIPCETAQSAEAQKASGYKITSHRLEFFGICPDCQKTGN